MENQLKSVHYITVSSSGKTISVRRCTYKLNPPTPKTHVIISLRTLLLSHLAIYPHSKPPLSPTFLNLLTSFYSISLSFQPSYFLFFRTPSSSPLSPSFLSLSSSLLHLFQTSSKLFHQHPSSIHPPPFPIHHLPLWASKTPVNIPDF